MPWPYDDEQQQLGQPQYQFGQMPMPGRLGNIRPPMGIPASSDMTLGQGIQAAAQGGDFAALGRTAGKQYKKRKAQGGWTGPDTGGGGGYYGGGGGGDYA